MECEMKNQENNTIITESNPLIMSNWCLKNTFINEKVFCDINIHVLGVCWCQPPRLAPLFPSEALLSLYCLSSNKKKKNWNDVCNIKLNLKKLIRFLVWIFWGSWVSAWEAKWSQFTQLMATAVNISHNSLSANHKAATTQHCNQKLSRFLRAGLRSRQDAVWWHEL